MYKGAHVVLSVTAKLTPVRRQNVRLVDTIVSSAGSGGSKNPRNQDNSRVYTPIPGDI